MQASGFLWTEGLAVIDHLPASDNFFIFSDVKKNVAYSWHAGTIEEFLNPSGCNAVSVVLFAVLRLLPTPVPCRCALYGVCPVPH